MLRFIWAATLSVLAICVRAQSSASQWCDSQTDICFQRFYFPELDMGWGYLFPPAGQSPNEFIGIFTAPANTGWIGNSLAGPMANNLLLVAWMNGGTPIISPRYTTFIGSPPVYSGPTVTILGSSGLNSTHQRIVYRCQNCTSWTGGSIPDSSTTFGWAAHGSLKPQNPSDPGSSLQQHSAVGRHNINIPSARSSSYQASLQTLLGLPTTSPTVAPTTTIPLPTGSLNCPGAPRPSYAMVAAPGYTAVPVLGSLSTPRGLAIDGRGNLLVVQRGRGLTVHTVDSVGCVTSSKTLISNSALNHGIDVYGDKLYVSSATTAWVYDYNDQAQTVSNQRTLITGMDTPYQHPTRTLWVSRKDPNYLVVSHGSYDNIDIPAYQASTGRAIVKVFDVRTSNSVNYASGGRVLGYGLRNDVGVTEDRAGNIVTVENSMDNAYRNTNGQNVDVHNDNPAEQVWHLGDPTNPSGAWYGYPYCFVVWEPNSFRDTQFRVGDWFVQAPNGTINDAWCGQTVAKRPMALLPPHSAPLDLKFGLGDDTNLYFGLHGSWNRQPPQGYKVVSIPGKYDASGVWSPNVSLESRQYESVLGNTNENNCNFGCFRPVGLAWAPNGYNLYVASDTTGEVFLVQKRSTGQPTTTPTPTSNPTSMPSSTTPSSTTSAPQPTQTLWGQCGGIGYNGPTACPPGSVCRYQNDWYSQCVPG